jgi:hypothetical protein
MCCSWVLQYTPLEWFDSFGLTPKKNLAVSFLKLMTKACHRPGAAQACVLQSLKEPVETKTTLSAPSPPRTRFPTPRRVDPLTISPSLQQALNMERVQILIQRLTQHETSVCDLLQAVGVPHDLALVIVSYCRLLSKHNLAYRRLYPS